MAGAATRSGSTPMRPRTAPLSGAPNWRSCQRPTAATTRSARSSPTRSTTPLRACRPRRARSATKERPWRSEGRARASAHAPAVAAATSWASGVTRGAIVRPISWSGPAALKMPSAATAMSGAAIAIGTARTSASSSAAAPSCPAPAPRARRRAVSPRRCSMRRPAVRTRAYPASTASWTASTVTLICATTSERLAASSAAPSEVTTVTCEVAIVDRRRPSSPSSSLEIASRRPGHHARRIREDAPRDTAAARVDDARIGGLVDDERAPRRVRGAHRAAADVAGHVPPVAVGHVLRLATCRRSARGRGATRRAGSSAPARRRPRSRAPPRPRRGSRPAPRPSTRLPASHRRRGSRARAGRRRRRTWRAGDRGGILAGKCPRVRLAAPLHARRLAAEDEARLLPDRGIGTGEDVGRAGDPDLEARRVRIGRRERALQAGG